MDIIEICNLTRIYKVKNGEDVVALKNINLNIKDNEIIGILGVNGAGKTTLIKILSTFLAPTSGTAKINGFNTFGEEKKIRGYINFIYGGERGLYWRLSAYDNLLYFGDLYKVPRKILRERIIELLKLVDLYEERNRKIETFSKGMFQKIQIARGLINDPRILYLDEPTIGLDPIAVKNLHEIIKKLKSQGKTIVLTTHYMEEADKLCDRIAFINKGEIADIGTPGELKIKHLKDEEGKLEEIFIKVAGA